MNNMKNIVSIILCIICIILCMIRINTIYTNKEIPDFSIELKNNEIISKTDLKGFDTRILFISHLNAITQSVIKETIEKHNPLINRTLILYYNNINKIDELKKNGIYYHKITNKNEINNMFNIENDSENQVIIYNSKGFLKEKFNIDGFNKFKITRSYRNYDGKKRGNIEFISKNILNILLQNNKNGVYYITNRLNSSCQAFKVFTDLENELFKRKRKLIVKLSGNWNDLDIRNFKIERNNRTRIEKVQKKIENIITEWKINTKSSVFVLVVIKIKDNSFTFPLYDENDYKKWYYFRKNNFNNIIAKFNDL